MTQPDPIRVCFLEVQVQTHFVSCYSVFQAICAQEYLIGYFHPGRLGRSPRSLAFALPSRNRLAQLPRHVSAWSSSLRCVLATEQHGKSDRILDLYPPLLVSVLRFHDLLQRRKRRVHSVCFLFLPFGGNESFVSENDRDLGGCPGFALVWKNLCALIHVLSDLSVLILNIFIAYAFLRSGWLNPPFPILFVKVFSMVFCRALKNQMCGLPRSTLGWFIACTCPSCATRAARRASC